MRYFGNPDGLHAVLREGDPAPLEVGPDVTVSPSSYILINDRGEELGSVQYAGPGITDANKWAVYFGPIGAPRQVMRDGDPAPGFPDGTTLVLAGGLPALAALNRVGDIVGITEIAGPGVTDEDKLVLWMRPHALRRWIPLLRTGDIVGGRAVYAADGLELAGGYASQTGGGDGLPQSFNDSGMLVHFAAGVWERRWR